MTKFPFVENAWTIYKVSNAQGVDVDIAFYMFKADICNGNNYNTKLVDVDFEIMKTKWDALSGDIKNDAIDSWDEFYCANFKKLTTAWVALDQKAFQEIVNKA